jgi:hypothetical protein
MAVKCTLSMRQKVSTACSASIDNFLPHAQQAYAFFYRLLSVCKFFEVIDSFLCACSVCVCVFFTF